MSRILGLGDNTVDTYTTAHIQYPGGNAVNVAVMARRLGAETAYLGCLGMDSAGDLILRALEAEQVDVSHCRRREGRNARVLIGHRDGDRYFIGSDRGVRGQYELTAADRDYIAGFDLVHSSIYSELNDEFPGLRPRIKQLSYDFSERWTYQLLRTTLPWIDIAFLSFPNRDTAECTDLLRTCIANGARMAVVTRGKDGALALADGRIYEQSIVPTEVTDTLGAGDGFIAAFLIAQLSGRSVAQSLQEAAAYGAEVCTWHGAFGHGTAWHGEGADIAARRS